MKILGSDFDGTLNYGGMTEEMLEAVEVNPKLNFKAYAVQTVGFETVNDAFAIIKGMEE